jgi:predicted amidohydrolase
MWENAFNVGGQDDGVIEQEEGPRLGVALCWELMRSQTVRRLRGNVDLVLSGSAWWSVPEWHPRAITRRMEAANSRLARRAVITFARYVGAPIVHASLCGRFECSGLGLPGRYVGQYEGPTGIYDAMGRPLAEIDAAEGPGVVTAEISPAATDPAEAPRERFWLHRRGALPAITWNLQRLLGRREYARTAMTRYDGKTGVRGKDAE